MQMTWAKKGPDLRLIYELTVTSIKQRYRKTWAGIFWVVVNPLLTYIVQAFVFKVVLKLQISNYLLFLLSGLIPWIFINQTFQMCTSIFTSQEQFIKSMTINPLYLYSAQVFDNFINMSISFAVLFIPIGYYMDTFQKGFMLPFLCFAPFVFVYSAGLILATVHVFYRDTKFIVEFAMSILYFLTPIFYTVDFLPGVLKKLVYFNPIYAAIEPFQIYFVDNHPTKFMYSLLRSYIWAAIFCLLAFLTWRRKRNELYMQL